MLNIAKQVLNMINNNGYKAYIVGGFVRDYLLGIESNDIDITTSATPKQLQEIFQDIDLASEEYGSVTLMIHKIRFEITTFRKEIQYIDNRRPLEIEYIDDLYQDLQRRDFTINTICMDKNLEIIDLLNGKRDLEQGIIKTVGDANKKLREDSLRILRAIRFSTNLGFCLSNDIELAIKENKHLLRHLSYNRKKQELDKIFANKNAKQGIELLLRFHLDRELELERLTDIKNTDSLISVWSILNVIDIYPFNNSEKELITSINRTLKLDNLDPRVLYDYGLYVNSVAGAIKGIDKKKITEAYNNLKIHSKKELEITSEEIMELLKKEPGEYLTEIYKDIENKILYGILDNQNDVIKNYILQEY
ncbi:MAG: CCA tRNA nucleotidyltransferase [Bacilli bacterium]|nr:CCA tRNA nucleotidyltransferase [Bacilli bacterium]